MNTSPRLMRDGGTNTLKPSRELVGAPGAPRAGTSTLDALSASTSRLRKSPGGSPSKHHARFTSSVSPTPRQTSVFLGKDRFAQFEAALLSSNNSSATAPLLEERSVSTSSSLNSISEARTPSSNESAGLGILARAGGEAGLPRSKGMQDLASGGALPSAMRPAPSPWRVLTPEEPEVRRRNADEGVFVEYARPGTTRVEVYHTESPKRVPYFFSYSLEQRDWDALLTSSIFDVLGGSGSLAYPSFGATAVAGLVAAKQGPRRVLDLGCGVTPHWVLHMAEEPGWEDTFFTGLDVMPVSVAHDLLPYHVNNRLNFIQHNFLQPLPFGDAKFDLVRIGHCALGVPETEWNAVIEEATRVLTPTGFLEIVDVDYQFSHRNPINVHAADEVEEGYFDSLCDVFSGACARRLVNLYSLHVIPPALLLSCREIKTTGVLFFDFPACPRSLEPQMDAAEGAAAPDPALKLMSGNQVLKRTKLEGVPNQDQRVLLHAVAERLDSTATLFSAEAAAKQALTMGASVPSATERELESLLHEWCSDLRSRASIGRLLEEQLDWPCTFDQELELALSKNISDYAEALKELDQMDVVVKHNLKAHLGEEGETDVQGRKARLRLAKREAETELRLVQRRLGVNEVAGNSAIGCLERAHWIARKA